ncbi:MAG: hypothetical protein K1Y36_17895 [Blastocatellia bacterium]|nr:hypothetical protein [Blastocatellia bacterium]
MGYYVRVFCTSREIPSIHTLIQSAQEAEVTFGVAVDVHTQLETPDWTRFDLIYNQRKQPVSIQCLRNSGPNSLAGLVVNEFLEELGDESYTVLDIDVTSHLRATEFIVQCWVPADFERDGFYALEEILAFCGYNCDGLIQDDNLGYIADAGVWYLAGCAHLTEHQYAPNSLGR